MTRSTLIAATLATLATSALTPAPALAEIKTLGQCYDAVITWCNETQPDNASGCAGSGLDQCDDEFANGQSGGIDRLKVLVQTPRPNGPTTYKWRAVRSAAMGPLMQIQGVQGESSDDRGRDDRTR